MTFSSRLRAIILHSLHPRLFVGYNIFFNQQFARFAAADWAVSSDRKVGEVGVIEVDGGYVVMYITAMAHLDETRAVNVRHILFQFKSTDSSGTTANLTDEQKTEYYNKAKTVYDQYLANPTEDNLQLLQTATAMTPVQIPKAAFTRMLSPVRWLLSLTTGALIHQENPAIPI